MASRREQLYKLLRLQIRREKARQIAYRMSGDKAGLLLDRVSYHVRAHSARKGRI